MFSRLNSKFYYWHLLLSFVILVFFLSCLVNYSQYLFLLQAKVPSHLASILSQDEWTKYCEMGRSAFRTVFYSRFITSAFPLIAFGFGLISKAWIRFDRVRALDRVPTPLKSFLFYFLYLGFELIVVFPLTHCFHRHFQFSPSLLFSLLYAWLWASIEPAIILLICFYAAKCGRFGMAIIFGLVVVLLTLIFTVIGPLSRIPGTTLNTDTVLISLANKVGFPSSRIRISATLLNAFAAGIGPLSIIVMGLPMKETFKVTEEEFQAFFAHELGHWSYGHSYYSLALGIVLTTVLMTGIFYLIQKPRFYAAFDIPTQDKKMPIAVGLIFVLVFWTHLEYVIRPIINGISWIYEYQADGHACKMGYKAGIEGGLRKFMDYSIFPVANGLFAIFNMDHPTLVDRILAIRAQ